MNRFFIFYIMLAFAACTPNEEKIQAKKKRRIDRQTN